MAFAQVLKYEGDNKTFVWKHPDEDFNSTTQLIVHESQEAVFFMNGQALDLFGPGRYTLETQNIPLIGKVLNIATGGDNPFHCEVYFINKTEQLNIKWGTDSRVQYIEPTYNFPISVGASGELSMAVVDSRKLLVKVVGTEKFIDQEGIMQKFRAFLMSKVKPYIAKEMREAAINIFEIDEHLIEFSSGIKELLNDDFADYGMQLNRFLITNFVKPEDDPMYKKFKELYFRQYADVADAKLRQQVELIDADTRAAKIVKDSAAQAKKREQEGYTYQQEKGFEVARDIANNEAKGQFTNLGVGLGTMAGVGVGMSKIVGGALNETANSTMQNTGATAVCKNCGHTLPSGAKFCLECGAKVDVEAKCPSCGKDIPSGSKFCPECGAKI